MTKYRTELKCLKNPDLRKEYVVSYELAPTLVWVKARSITVRYIPDRLILEHHSLKNYLNCLKSLDFQSLEELALKITDDLMDQLIPKWVEVNIWTEEMSGDKLIVTIEDKQPNWHNDALLGRLTRI